MLAEQFELQIIEIPERSTVATPQPAVGLAEVVKPRGTANPFDISDTLTKSVSDYLTVRELLPTNPDHAK
jgi:hypothetical protein